MASKPATEPAKMAVPGSVLLVIHDFIARSPDELTLRKGDRIELIEKDDDFGDGWVSWEASGQRADWALP
ncbi:hypothetical protein MRB53_039809 [Persea americana]|nr:hypothetical protein MRB53_039809 [Persea americana]